MKWDMLGAVHMFGKRTSVCVLFFKVAKNFPVYEERKQNVK